MPDGQLIGLPVPEPEPFVTRAQLAKHLGMHVNTLDELRKEPGFPEERWGLRTPRFQVSRVVAYLRTREARKMAA